MEPEAAALPEAYGTGTLLLLVSDPHWLYAHWDLGPEEQRPYYDRAANRRLVLRGRQDALTGPVLAEIHVPPDSRDWFFRVPRAPARCVAELGYYLEGGQWVSIAASNAVATPPEAPSEDKTAQFAAVEPALLMPAAAAGLPAKRPPSLARGEAEARRDWVEAEAAPPKSMSEGPLRQGRPAPVCRGPDAGARPFQTRPQGLEPAERGTQAGPGPRLRLVPPGSVAAWTVEQEQALAEAIQPAGPRADGADSLGIAELVRHPLEWEMGPRARRNWNWACPSWPRSWRA